MADEEQPKTPQAKYLWQKRYLAALIETDSFVLPNRIKAAKDVIKRRLHALKPRGSSHAMTEYQAIRDAEAILNTLEKLKR